MSARFCKTQYMFPRINNSLYDARHERDACGVGFVANTNGKKERRILDFGLEALCSLAHRGALDADAKTGDGAGVLIQLPQSFFRSQSAKIGAALKDESDIGVGFIFLPPENSKIEAAQRIVDEVCERFSIQRLGWRDVPTNPLCLGDKAKSTMPVMKQILVARSEGWDDEEFERRLFLARKLSGIRAREEGIDAFYIPSFSSRTIVYKGLFNAPPAASVLYRPAEPAV